MSYGSTVKIIIQKSFCCKVTAGAASKYCLVFRYFKLSSNKIISIIIYTSFFFLHQSLGILQGLATSYYLKNLLEKASKFKLRTFYFCGTAMVKELYRHIFGAALKFVFSLRDYIQLLNVILNQKFYCVDF